MLCVLLCKVFGFGLTTADSEQGSIQDFFLLHLHHLTIPAFYKDNGVVIQTTKISSIVTIRDRRRHHIHFDYNIQILYFFSLPGKQNERLQHASITHSNLGISHHKFVSRSGHKHTFSGMAY